MFKVQATYINGITQVYPQTHATKEDAQRQVRLYKACDKVSHLPKTKYKIVSA